MGTIFYAYEFNVGWAVGFYKAVDVGYSIGWGSFGEYDNSENVWFSVFFLLVGSSFVAYALGIFASHIIADNDNWYA